jgi:hypothetical protein
MLTDVMTKTPITNAVILCNDKQNPYICKNEGYYIFADLYPSKYNVKIFCNGYVKTNFECNLSPKESRYFMIEMSYESFNSSLINIPRFEFLIKKNCKKIKNKKILLVLKTPIKFLKIIKKAKKDDKLLVLNIPDDNSLFPQHYIYIYKIDQNKKNENNELDEELELTENELEEENLDDLEDIEEELLDDSKNKKEPEIIKDIEQKIFIIGYEEKSNAYILDEPLPENFQIGGKFYLYWELLTDTKGKAVLPFLDRFMKDSKLEFELEFNNKKIEITADLNKFDQVYKTLLIEVEI